MSFDTSLYLYNVTLKRPSTSVSSILGSFSGSKSNDILIARSTVLEFWQASKDGKLSKIFEQETFGVIRNMVEIRISGSIKSQVALTSDSGALSVLEVDVKNNKFVSLYNELYGKTGIRRVVPGEYLVVDGSKRCIMTTAIEKNKLVYQFSRDNENKLRISSPLEASKSKVLTFALCGLDSGYSNPLFAAIECDYGEFEYRDWDPESTPLTLAFYELDQGLNHVIKKWTDSISASSNHLVSVPGGEDGPSGVLVCSKNMIAYKNLNSTAHYIPIPKRSNQTVDSHIIASVVHRMKNRFLILLQSDLGDIFKVTLDFDDDVVSGLSVKYFDTIPVCNQMLVMKNGYMLAETEHGDKLVYQFQKLGDDDEEIVFKSESYSDELSVLEEDSARFDVRPLDNMELTDTIDSLNPIISSKLMKEEETQDVPQIYTLCGKGSRSSLKILENALSVSELVSSELPEFPTGVWTTKRTLHEEFDKYLVLSFADSTLVLSIGEDVEEISDSGLILDEPSLCVQQLGLNSLMQVLPSKIVHLDKNGKQTDWLPPAGIKIIKASSTNYQLAIALSNREIVYFEIDDDESLIEYEERLEMSGRITSLALGDIPQGKLRSPHLAVGCNDSTIRMLSVDPRSTLETLSLQSLSSVPTDLKVMSMIDSSLESDGASTLYVHIGMESGAYVRTILDPINGTLSSDISLRYLGPKAVTLSKIRVVNQDCILAMSTKPWLGYTSGAEFKLTPLSYMGLNDVAGFSSEDCPMGVVGISERNLSIMTIDSITEGIKSVSIPLRYTPRDMVENENSGIFYVIGSDYNTKSPYLAEEEVDQDYYMNFGYEQVKESWGSCIQVIDTKNREYLANIELDDNENCVAVSKCHFQSNEQTYLIVSTNQNQKFLPNSKTASYLRTYRILNDGRSLEFVHKFEVDDAPVAMIEFQGKLLIGIRDTLVLYDIGQKRLLRKAFGRLNCKQIVKLTSQGFRIVVGDIRQSTTVVVYKPEKNMFIPFVDDVISRHTTAIAMLDYDTIIGGDKFGNIWVNRIPETASQVADEDNHGTFLIMQDQYLQGAPYRLDQLCHFYLHDIPTSFNKGTLTVSGKEAVIYSGLNGTIGLLVPIITRQEIEFFVKLENLVRQYDLSILGRQHLNYRGYYAPVKGVIDGDLAERFSYLPTATKIKIANELDRTPREVERKINEMRTRSAF